MAVLTSTAGAGLMLVLACSALQGIFVAQGIVAIAAFAVLGRASVEVIAIVGVSLQALPLGRFVGEPALRRMSRAQFGKAMRLILLATAAVAMVGSRSN